MKAVFVSNTRTASTPDVTMITGHLASLELFL